MKKFSMPAQMKLPQTLPQENLRRHYWRIHEENLIIINRETHKIIGEYVFEGAADFQMALIKKFSN